MQSLNDLLWDVIIKQSLAFSITITVTVIVIVTVRQYESVVCFDCRAGKGTQQIVDKNYRVVLKEKFSS